jgi:4-hydroxybenzoate polyprenyltransferase
LQHSRYYDPEVLTAMTITARASISPITLLRLGRVSNLPTVWTNVLAGAVLAGGDWRSWGFGFVLLAMSLFYIGGMYLNDYFDRTIDVRERPERPIPSGAISAYAAAVIGLGLLSGGFILIAGTGAITGTALAALLVGAIVAYDFNHKGNPLAPIVMGACRALVYGATAAVLTGGVSIFVVVTAAAIAAYVAGLSYAARQESLDRVGNLWPLVLLVAPIVVAAGAFRQGPDAMAIHASLAGWTGAAVFLLAKRPATGSVSRAVSWLIAGISLCDAAFLASVDAVTPALVAMGGFCFTLVGQKYVAGT